MPIVVMKFGGSSVADTEKIERVADRVVATKRDGFDVVVVVSAMGGQTDALLALAKRITDAPPRRELDMLVSTGERVSMALLSMAIQKRGAEAISFTGSQSGIITSDRHFDARIIEVRPHRVEDELARGRVVIVAGYQGMSYRREITTLGRGGSDTTALAMAAALKAERAEIYSDVDGVYSADPRVVPDAAHLPSLDYATMQEMADAGAKVLHAGAVEFARRAGLRIHARATFAPGRETVVGAEPNAAARAVVGMKAIVRVEASDPVRARHARKAAEAGQVPEVAVEGAEGGAPAFYLDTRHAPDWPKVAASLEEAIGPEGVITGGFAAVTVVGHVAAGDESRMAGVLPGGGGAARVAATPLRLRALVAEAQIDDAVRALHREFVASPRA